MSESESEDEILDRIEEALRKIASVTEASKPAPVGDLPLDREALVATLDSVIARLRGELTPPQPPTTE
ncbi:hypothetical protein [Acidocella aminolytica]|jgi:hypothetical protein|uniref:Uncharacterized protein n=1 Tax=Acidocella aminolytica 101 = DSM 11237 TaxID=1120923 RepID=A0A0D6PF28_9PROT|nr:hypothetical protein [Acidocella aminolytica]GAN80267.1 hypothetical protein Aam_041_034 [Acidocella aminolytica 101 = DSM 11237]GBQ44702.1 hypothetical protein AA11237_3568 [Acidocella aminolytica 101 = DSM 11237]SHE93001.1 hypothetical protein SAMN02746095_01611 [Acidocella aminolytica 101 = DSM 11237]